MTICPCCGFRFEGDLRQGCVECGARAVGEPLPKPELELPAYGRSLLLAGMGTAMVVAFLIQTIIALAKNTPIQFGFWDFVAAGETAAWRIKWISIPVALVVLWSGQRIYKSMRRAPERFVGLRMARRGMIASFSICLLIATLIGVTVPARLEQRRISLEAAQNATAQTLMRAQLEYQALHSTFPLELRDLAALPDPDGSIAAALRDVDPAAYQPRADVAAVPAEKSQRLTGAAIRKASVTNAEEPAAGLEFTNYYLLLPGPDKILRTDDDLLMHDGVIQKASEVKDAPVLVRTQARTGRR